MLLHQMSRLPVGESFVIAARAHSLRIQRASESAFHVWLIDAEDGVLLQLTLPMSTLKLFMNLSAEHSGKDSASV
jgi:hypothetical protein